LLRKQRKTLGGYFILPHPVVHIEELSTSPSSRAFSTRTHRWITAVLCCSVTSIRSTDENQYERGDFLTTTAAVGLRHSALLLLAQKVSILLLTYKW